MKLLQREEPLSHLKNTPQNTNQESKLPAIPSSWFEIQSFQQVTSWPTNRSEPLKKTWQKTPAFQKLAPKAIICLNCLIMSRVKKKKKKNLQTWDLWKDEFYLSNSLMKTAAEGANPLRIVEPVTVLESPPMIVVGFVGYAPRPTKPWQSGCRDASGWSWLCLVILIVWHCFAIITWRPYLEYIWIVFS